MVGIVWFWFVWLGSHLGFVNPLYKHLLSLFDLFLSFSLDLGFCFGFWLEELSLELDLDIDLSSSSVA
jgi:hypothetical protein